MINHTPRFAHRPVAWTEPVDPLDRAPADVREAWGRAHEALAHEHQSQALECIHEAIRCADPADAELARRLACGRYALEIESDREFDPSALRDILATAETTATAYLASYQMARFLELQRSWKKALYYAREALTSSRIMGIAAWSASAENMIGNILVAESRFEEAEQHYRKAISLCTDQKGSSSLVLDRALASDNLSFTLCCLKREADARPFLAHALWALRRTEGPSRLSVELDAAVLHLRQGRPRRALAYAEHAVERARNHGDERNLSNALFVVAEAGKRAGMPFVARRALVELGERYDAEFAFALSQFDILEIVNLRA